MSPLVHRDNRQNSEQKVELFNEPGDLLHYFEEKRYKITHQTRPSAMLRLYSSQNASTTVPHHIIT